MSSREVRLIVSKDLIPTKSDLLLSDCLQISCPSTVNLAYGKPTQVNLTISNGSSSGRMASLQANFNPREVTVSLPHTMVYVGPGCKTTVCALITCIINNGFSGVTFNVS